MARYNDGEWRTQAACRNLDPELFFPLGTNAQQIEQAKQVCGACAVRAECLEFALVTNQDHGVWGGASEDERRKLRRQWLTQQRRQAAK